MGKVQFGVIVVLLLAMVGLQAKPLFTSAPPPPVIAWDYRIESFHDEVLMKKLNELGGDGWEVVSARRALDGSTGIYELMLRKQH